MMLVVIIIASLCVSIWCFFRWKRRDVDRYAEGFAIIEIGGRGRVKTIERMVRRRQKENE